jgi:hypothetical protein
MFYVEKCCLFICSVRVQPVNDACLAAVCKIIGDSMLKHNLLQEFFFLNLPIGRFRKRFQ